MTGSKTNKYFIQAHRKAEPKQLETFKIKNLPDGPVNIQSSQARAIELTSSQNELSGQSLIPRQKKKKCKGSN